MLGFLKHRILGEDSNIKFRKSDSGQQNPINEIQVLEGHTDIVRFLIKVDELRIASGSDDGTVRIWNRVTGECVTTLTGHTHPITCMILLERLLITGSADKTIRTWDLQNYTCRLLRGHEGSVKCIVSLGNGKFCSGSNDRHLLIWKTNENEPIGKIERQEEENIQCILPIVNNRLVTGSNSSLLLVYKTDALSYHKVLAYHRESVRCLVRISNILFASASMDGAIVVWQAETLTPLKILNNPDKYRNDQRVYIFNVKYLLALSEKYLAAAIGNGFRIYEVNTGDIVLDCKDAHQAEVNNIITLYDGTRIVSCSADSSIKVWTTSQKVSFKKKDRNVNSNSNMSDSENSSTETSSDKKKRLANRKNKTNKRSKVQKADIILQGEMSAHSDIVNHLLPFTESGFASCSNDGLVILWKDGHTESELRNKFASLMMQQQVESLERENLQVPQTPNIYQTDEPTPVTQLSNSPTSEEIGSRRKSTRLPDYIFDYAERLRKEKKFSIEEIADDLQKQGHSESIISAVIEKQQVAVKTVPEK